MDGKQPEKQPEKQPVRKPETFHLGKPQGGATVILPPSRETQLIEAGERAAIKDQQQASHPDRGKEYPYHESLGETTRTEVCELLSNLKKFDQMANHINATIARFHHAKRILVCLETTSVHGQPPALNRLVIEIDRKEETDVPLSNAR